MLVTPSISAIFGFTQLKCEKSGLVAFQTSEVLVVQISSTLMVFLRITQVFLSLKEDHDTQGGSNVYHYCDYLIQ